MFADRWIVSLIFFFRWSWHEGAVGGALGGRSPGGLWWWDFFLSHRGLIYFYTVYYSVICRPSDPTVGEATGQDSNPGHYRGRWTPTTRPPHLLMIPPYWSLSPVIADFLHQPTHTNLSFFLMSRFNFFLSDTFEKWYMWAHIRKVIFVSNIFDTFLNCEQHILKFIFVSNTFDTFLIVSNTF